VLLDGNTPVENGLVPVGPLEKVELLAGNGTEVDRAAEEPVPMVMVAVDVRFNGIVIVAETPLDKVKYGVVIGVVLLFDKVVPTGELPLVLDSEEGPVEKTEEDVEELVEIVVLEEEVPVEKIDKVEELVGSADAVLEELLELEDLVGFGP